MSETDGRALSVRDIVDLEAWLDPRFKDELQRDPEAAMAKMAQKYDVEIPSGVTFRVLSDSGTEYHLILSNSPVGDAPAAAESEVSAYMETIAAPQPGTASPSNLFCNPNISDLRITGTIVYGKCKFGPRP